MIAARVEPGWMRSVRAHARERFSAMAWPTPAEEEWRRTDISAVDPLSYTTRLAREPLDLGTAGTARDTSGNAGVVGFEAGTCVISSLKERWRDAGVRLLPLEQAFEEYESPLRGIIEREVHEADNRFVMWHFGELSHGAALIIPPFLEIEEPFLLDFVERGARLLSSPHVVVILGEGARASVVQRIAAAAEGGGASGREARREGESASEEILCNAGLDIQVGDGAGLAYYEIQTLGSRSLYFRNARIEMGRDASLRHFDAAFGARMLKTRVECSLNGAGADARLDGLYFCRPGQHMDIRTVQYHRAPSATSRAYYKGAVSGGGRTVFQGLIEVAEGASGTDAFLTNRNLILGDAARADSIPTLKIGNNDVKCSHGPTTGRLSEEEMFYLESRGLPPEDAKAMLLVGYFEDILGNAPESFRQETLEHIGERIGAVA